MESISFFTISYLNFNFMSTLFILILYLFIYAMKLCETDLNK